MKSEKHVIWSSYLGELENWRDAFEDGEDLSEEELYERAADLNAEYFFDETDYNLRNAEVYAPILVIADLGLWNGRRSGYKEMICSNVGEAVRRACDLDLSSGEVYVDELGDLCITQPHHDGINYLLLREWKENATEAAKKNLRNKIYYGTATRKDITRCTRRLGDRIAEVYGWNIRGIKKGA